MAKHLDKYKKVFEAVPVEEKGFRHRTVETVLTIEQAKARKEMCGKKMLCFISLKPLGEDFTMTPHSKAVGMVGIANKYFDLTVKEN